MALEVNPNCASLPFNLVGMIVFIGFNKVLVSIKGEWPIIQNYWQITSPLT
jgi:hypothetical protein